MTINVTKSAVTLFNNEVEECNLPSDWLNQSSFWRHWTWPSISKYQNIKWNDKNNVPVLLPLSGSCIQQIHTNSNGSCNTYQSHRMPPTVARDLSLMKQTFPWVPLVISGSLQSYPQQFHKEYSLPMECVLVLCL